MSRCLITYETFPGPGDYSPAGLRLLARQLGQLARLDFSAEEQRQEAIARAGKMSIQGVQPKLSAVLRVGLGRLEIVDRGGTYILKPQVPDYPELPQNEDLTMRLAATVGIDTPTHGLIYGRDGLLTYFVRRFDRVGHSSKVPVEDFAQLSGGSRETKYNSSMEKVVDVIDRFCTFPAIERMRLFERMLFNFLVGNEDMHLKNYALISRGGNVQLAPAFDFLNTTIAIRNAAEEIALPIRGRKSRLTRSDLFDYFARERLELNDGVIEEIVGRFGVATKEWPARIDQSFLSPEMKSVYRDVLEERRRRMLPGD